MANPILESADRVLKTQTASSEIGKVAADLFARGVLKAGDLPEAAQIVFDGGLPAQLSSVVTHICAHICTIMYQKQQTEKDLAGAIHFLAAENLSERQDLNSHCLAVDHYQEARRFLAPDDPDFARAQINEAVSLCKLADLGDRPIDRLSAAFNLFRTALEHSALVPSDRHECSMGIRKVSVGLSRLGTAPIENLEAALGIPLGNEVGDSGKVQHAERLVNEAVIYISIADYGQAPVRNLNRADELLDRALPDLASGSESFGIALLNKGVVQYRLAQYDPEPVGRLTDAINHFRRCRDHLDSQHSAYLRALGNEATSRSLLGQFGGDTRQNQAALACCKEIRDLLVRAKKTIPGDLLVNEGVILVRIADGNKESREVLQRALALFQEATAVLPPDHPEWGTARRNQGRAHWQLDDLESAQRSFGEGLNSFERIRGQMRREHERTGFWETIVHEYGEMVELCLEVAGSVLPPDEAARLNPTSAAWHWVHRAKSRSLLELLSRDNTKMTSETLGMYEEVRAISRSLDGLDRALRKRLQKDVGTTDTPQEDSASRREEVLGQLRDAREQLLLAVEESIGTITPEVPPTGDVVHHLQQLGLRPTDGSGQPIPPAAKTLLVEFFMLDSRRLAVFLLPLWKASEPIVRLVSLQGPTIVELARTLSESVAKLRNTTRARAVSDAPHASEQERDDARQCLARLPHDLSALIEPWADLLRSSSAPTEIVIAPHYFTSLLPLHAAMLDGKPLIEHFPVSYLPAASLAGEILRRRRPSAASALLVGNPTLDLAGAEVEIGNVSRCLMVGGITHRALVGSEATTRRVHEHAVTASVVHFAGHSVLDPTDFFRSGLELADGRLTVFEMRVGLDLQRATLVYLSSCDSGQPIPGRTDDLMALARMFFSAGSPTVVASMWSVDDGAACSFADYFYRFWIGDRDTAGVALRRATIALKNDLRNPFYWAPFVLIGAWNSCVAQKGVQNEHV